MAFKIYQILHKFYFSYAEAIQENGHSIENVEPLLEKLLELVASQLKHPYLFSLYHEGIRTPYDYYAFGLDLIRPLIIFKDSKVEGLDHIKKMIGQLEQNHNVILFANHQTEPDPQVISLLLESTYPKFAEKMIFVAGQRVIHDPLAIPFSMGRNLLCIFSKKYLETPPEQKQEKLLHNQRTMKKMVQLLAEGGKCIYVAPSGGRDRPNAAGKIDVAKFDPQSIEMFYLMAQQASRPTHFYPLSLATYHLLPPPNSIERELGEKRHTQATPVLMAFGEELDMEKFPENATLDKRQKRKVRSESIWEQVKKNYDRLTSSSNLSL